MNSNVEEYLEISFDLIKKGCTGCFNETNAIGNIDSYKYTISKLNKMDWSMFNLNDVNHVICANAQTIELIYDFKVYNGDLQYYEKHNGNIFIIQTLNNLLELIQKRFQEFEALITGFVKTGGAEE